MSSYRLVHFERVEGTLGSLRTTREKTMNTEEKTTQKSKTSPHIAHPGRCISLAQVDVLQPTRLCIKQRRSSPATFSALEQCMFSEREDSGFSIV
jgi:hypothetical protein